MATNKLDMAHLAFLGMLEEAIEMYGGGPARSQLLRRALGVADTIPEVDYKDLEAWEDAIKTGDHPLARIEGRTVRRGHLFSLPDCPFGASIDAWRDAHGEFSEYFAEGVAEFNRPTRMSRELRVGHGSGGNPFCLLHQPLRAAIAKRLTIGGQAVRIVQLACRAGDGTRTLAEPFIEESKTPRELVESFLDRGARCVYLVEVVEEE